MISIGVCDDDLAFTEQMYRFITEYGRRTHTELTVRQFDSAEELVESLEQKAAFELLFLDIEMDEMDGIALGKWLREREHQILIVYVSGYDKYLRQLFEIEPFRFCEKPVRQKELEDVLDKAVARILSRNRETFHFQYGKNVVNLLCADILYLESSGRKVVVHAKNSSYEYYDKLDHAEEELADKGFVRIHKAYLINMDYLEAFQYDKLALRDGTILNISEKHRARVRSIFWDYLKAEDHEKEETMK